MTFPGSQRGPGLSSELQMQFMESSGESSRAPTMCRTRAVPAGAAPGPVLMPARDPLIAPRASRGSCCQEATAQGVSAMLLHVCPFLPPCAKCSWSTVSVSGVLAKRWPHHTWPKPRLLFRPICSCKPRQEAPKGAGLQLRRQWFLAVTPAAAFTRPGQEHRAGNLGPEGGDRGGSGAAWPSTTCRASHPITSQHLASPGLLLPSPKRARGRPHHAPGAPSAASGLCCPHPPHPVPPCHGTRGRFTTRSCCRRIQRVHDMNYKSPSREEAARSRLSHCSYLSLPPFFFWRLITILWIFSTKGHLFECICFFINVC